MCERLAFSAGEAEVVVAEIADLRDRQEEERVHAVWMADSRALKLIPSRTISVLIRSRRNSAGLISVGIG